MLILLAQLSLVISITAVLLQHLGVAVLQPLYPDHFGSDAGLVIGYLFVLASTGTTGLLMAQRSRRRRTKQGFTFPSELHARWTTHLDNLSIPWRYHNESLCSGGHHMQIQLGGQSLCALVFNVSELNRRTTRKISRSNCQRPKAILGNYPRKQKGAVGWFQMAPGEPWQPIPTIGPTPDNPDETPTGHRG